MLTASLARQQQTRGTASRDRPAARSQIASREPPSSPPPASPAHEQLNNNALTSLPAELGQLGLLRRLIVRCRLGSDLRDLTRLQVLRNNLSWLPMELDRLPSTTQICVS